MKWNQIKLKSKGKIGTSGKFTSAFFNKHLMEESSNMSVRFGVFLSLLNTFVLIEITSQ